MRFFRKTKNTEVNDRGAAIYQDKSWQRMLLPKRTLFIHCGSAPFAQYTDRLMRSKAKEICSVTGTSETKFILCFPLLNMRPHDVPEVLTLSKPCRMLWTVDEMPRGFVFQLPAGTEVWTDNASLSENQEVGLAFDVVFEDFLVAQFQRTNNAQMRLVNLNGVSWL